MISSWQVGAVMNGVIAIAYFAISATILTGLWRRNQLRSNPLAFLTGAIFFTCAAGHATHLEHLLFGPEVPAAREAFDWHMTWVDTVTAVIGVAYWQMRGRFGALLRPAMFADKAARDQYAARVQGTVLTELVAAELARQEGDEEALERALGRATRATRDILDGLDAEVVQAA